ncbi:MAG: hypothetical protein ABSE47_07985 [Acidimicrobiales bacterium]
MRLVLRPPRWWWIAIARDHERRREATQTLRLTMASDLPVYGLGDEWDGTRDVRIGLCRATFRRGRFGLRMQDGPVVVDEITAHHAAPDGCMLLVTSHRRGMDVDRSRLVNNFLSVSWVIDHADTERRVELRSGGKSSWRSDWSPVEMWVDGIPARFERLDIDGHWLALGTVDGMHVSIEGHGISSNQSRLSRITDVTTWVRSPDFPVVNRPIRDLGDRLGDLFGLP